MPSLGDLTDPNAVLLAIDEFDTLGRAAFLQKYALTPSSDYFLLHSGKLYDSKPILVVAYQREHPGAGGLHVGDFSGGTGGAVAALKRLGHQTVTRAQIRPPALGDEYSSRTGVYDAYGGDKVAGVIRFPGDPVVNVFSDADGPYADDPPTLTAPFGYRGEGLKGPQRVEAGGNARLEAARVGRESVRFWYRPAGGSFTFLTWAAVLGRAWIPGEGTDRLPRPELEWMLQAVPAPDAAAWPEAVLAGLEPPGQASASSNVPEARPAATYDELLARVETRAPAPPAGAVVRTDYARSAAARRAVLLRCEGKCENPSCTGMPGEPNRRGEPILDVDHVHDLALGGADHPRNMVALCPNCHAVKTRGKNARAMRQQLKAIALAAHKKAVADAGK